jgi:putative membrane protein
VRAEVPLRDPNPPQLDDARIMAIADAANDAEIEQARLARVRAKDTRVRELAALMMKHHAEARREQQKLEVDPEPGADVLNRKRESERQLAELREKKGTEFDRAYLELQIEQHRALLDKIERELLPAAQDASVAAYLKEIQPRVVSHLAEAERLRQELGATGQRDPREDESERPLISNSRGSSARLSEPR